MASNYKHNKKSLDEYFSGLSLSNSGNLGTNPICFRLSSYGYTDIDGAFNYPKYTKDGIWGYKAHSSLIKFKKEGEPLPFADISSCPIPKRSSLNNGYYDPADYYINNNKHTVSYTVHIPYSSRTDYDINKSKYYFLQYSKDSDTTTFYKSTTSTTAEMLCTFSGSCVILDITGFGGKGADANSTKGEAGGGGAGGTYASIVLNLANMLEGNETLSNALAIGYYDESTTQGVWCKTKARSDTVDFFRVYLFARIPDGGSAAGMQGGFGNANSEGVFFDLPMNRGDKLIADLLDTCTGSDGGNGGYVVGTYLDDGDWGDRLTSDTLTNIFNSTEAIDGSDVWAGRAGDSTEEKPGGGGAGVAITTGTASSGNENTRGTGAGGHAHNSSVSNGYEGAVGQGGGGGAMRPDGGNGTGGNPGPAQITVWGISPDWNA